MNPHAHDNPDEHPAWSRPSHKSDEAVDSDQSRGAAAAASATTAAEAAGPWYEQAPDEPYDMALRMLEIIDRLPDEHAEQAWDQLGDHGLRGYVFAVGLHRDLERAHGQAPTQDDTSAQPTA